MTCHHLFTMNDYLFRSGNRSRYLGCAKGETRGDRRLETTPAVGLLRQRLTYDTFWRTFYAFRTTRSRIRNDELFDRNDELFNRTAIIHDPSRLIRVQYLFNIGL